MGSSLSTPASAATAVVPGQAATLITPSTDLAVLCPSLDGKSIADSGGAKYSVSCDWTMEAEGKAVEVEGTTTPLICLEACEEATDCYSVNIAADGSCSLISGKETGMKYDAGLVNLFRLSQTATTTAAPVQITTTLSTAASSVIATASAVPEACDLSLTKICPACDDKIVPDASGKSYHIFCDSSLHTNGTYSVQEYLSAEGCLNQCDTLGFCLGASYYDDRSCEIAKGPVVYTQFEAGYTAFLPVANAAATASAKPSTGSVGRATTLQSSSIKSTTVNTTSTSLAPYPSVSTLPISSGCNTSSLTCPECDGVRVNDQLNQTYTALCKFAPVCDSTAVLSGPITQDECLQGCDQDGTCLAVMWFASQNDCRLCQQGLDGGAGDATDYIVMVADIDGGDNSPSSTTLSASTYSNYSSTATRPAIYSTGALQPPVPYSSSFAVSTTTSYSIPSPFLPSRTINPGGPIVNATSSAGVPNITAAVCPGLGESVFVDPTDFNFYEVMCDSIITAAHSRYTTASDFADCVASCTADCDGVQYGYTSRCGLYQGISIVGPGTGWTIAASLTFPTSTGAPYSTIAAPTLTASSNEVVMPMPEMTMPMPGSRAA